MDYKRLPKLRIGNLEADIPIIQGGMGIGVSLSGLASASVVFESPSGVQRSVGMGVSALIWIMMAGCKG